MYYLFDWHVRNYDEDNSYNDYDDDVDNDNSICEHFHAVLLT